MKKRHQLKILLTGGSGLLGSEIRRINSSVIAPTHYELDLANFKSIIDAIEKYRPDIVLNAAANNEPPKHETEPERGIVHNIIGSANVALACLQKKVRLVHISTDFVYSGKGPHKETEPLLPPSNFAWSKLGSECAVRLVPESLILRVDFGPVPFQWERVYQGKYVSKLYVDEIAPLILNIVETGAKGVINVGGERTTLEAYARRTRPNIETTERPKWVPRDTSMDISKLKELLGLKGLESFLKHR